MTILFKKGPGLSTILKWFPKGFTFVITMIALFGTLITAIKTGDPLLFIRELGIKIFLSDMSLQSTITTLKSTDPVFWTRAGLFIESLGDVLMIYYLNKGLAKIYSGITGSGGAWVGYWLVSFSVLGAIEFAVASVVKNQLIIPYMGVFMFIMNAPLFIEPLVNSYKNFIGTTRYLEHYNKTILDYALNNYNQSAINSTP